MANDDVLGLKQILLITLLGILAPESRKYVFEVCKVGLFPEKNGNNFFFCE